MIKSDKATKYVMLKRCVNCSTNNNPENNACDSCGLLFVENMNFNAWTNYCAELAQKAKDKEKEEN